MLKTTATFCLLFFCTFSFLCIGNFGAYAQNVGDYRTNGNVNFASATGWLRYNGTTWVAATTAPTSADGTVYINGLHTAQVTSNVTLDQLTVDGILQVNNGFTLTLADGIGNDLFVRNRLFFEATGVINGTGQLVLGNQAIVQTANVGGLAASITSTNPTLTTGASYWFNGTVAQSTGFASLGNPLNLYFANTVGVTIDKNLTIIGQLNSINNANITIGIGVSSLVATTIYNNGTFNNCVGAIITPAYTAPEWRTKGIYQSSDNSEPSTQASNIWTNSNKTTVHTYWLKNGSGNKRMVVLKAGSPVNPNTVIDNTTYTANTIFGSGTPIDGGFVVYNGTGSQVDVTGLSEGTTYHVAVFEYNQDCSGNRNYNINNPLTTSFVANERPFITEWITNDGTLTIPTSLDATYNYTVSYRQLPSGSPTILTGRTGNTTLTGLVNGVTYEISITGTFPRIHFGGSTDINAAKIYNIKQWGSGKWTSMLEAFGSVYGNKCSNLNSNATDVPNLSNVSSMSSMFHGCFNFNGSNMENWNTESVTSMVYMFSNATSFNQPIGNWNTQNVLDMSGMFNSATSFNQPIGNWNTQNVLNMSGMFNSATSFNQPIGNWNTQKVIDMSWMFKEATSFNQPIGNWDTKNVWNMNYMFNTATSFNQPIGNWNTQKVTKMGFMFQYATSFNQPIGNWDTQNVNDMKCIFEGATSFNQSIENWNTQYITNMGSMFKGATSFNQSIENWLTQNVSDMSYMFQGATSFNQSIGNLNTQNVINMQGMFSNATSFDQPIGNWNTKNVTNMSYMFQGATSFNQPIGNWNTQNVINMDFMFSRAASFNQPIGNWNMQKVTTMAAMFLQATSFNQPIGNWDTKSLFNMNMMFAEATSFNQPIGTWDTKGVFGMNGIFYRAISFDQPLGNWNITNVINADLLFAGWTGMPAMLDSCGMSRANYDSTLIGWAAQNVQTGVCLGATGLKYCEGNIARNKLVTTKNWVITNDTLLCKLYLSGNVYSDINNNCNKDLAEVGVKSLVVKATPGNYYAMTDANGNYKFGLSTDGTYQIEVLPQTPVGSTNTITAVCPPKTATVTTGTPNITGIDFGVKGKLCTQLAVNVSINRFRRCFEGDTYITYKNTGLIPATNATITVELPDDIQAVSSVPAWTSQTGNTLTYEINQINALEGSTIILKHLVVCGNEAIRGEERCIKATISPANYCLPTVSPTWDNADLIANSTCLNNKMGRFVIKNVGTGNMADSTNYRIFFDNVIVRTGKVKLLANEEFAIEINNPNQVLRIEVEQTPQHPTGLPAMAFFNRCGAIPTSATFNQQLPNFNNIATGSACETIRDSYDPNDKRIMPAGVTAQNIVEKDQELEFQIRFQNEGNDEAYKVVVRDTLDPNLDIASIRTIATSHNNTVSMEGEGQGIVIWTFDNINLPAKSVDEAGSIGMITFRIRMKPNLPIGTEVKNKAGIYFDFNSPIITNEALVRIGQLPTDLGNPANNNTVFPCPASPSVAVAGSNQTISTTSTTLAATPIVKGYGKWSVVQGSATFADEFSPTSTVSNLSFGLNILKWTSHLCNTTSTSEVQILVQVGTNFTPTSGGIDTRITITGTNFTPNSAVSINGVPVRRLWYYSPSKIVVQVADGTSTGKINIDGIDTSTDFTVVDCAEPTGVSAVTGTGANAAITVNWTNPSAVNRVDIVYRLAGTSLPDTELSRINTGKTNEGANSFTIIGLDADVDYDVFVQIRCIDGVTWSNWVSAGTVTSSVGTTCTKPTISSPANNSTLAALQANLTWSAVANATNYQVFTVEVDGGLQPVGGTSVVTTVSTPSATVNFPKPSTKYRVLVRANCGATGLGEYNDNFYVTTGAVTACLPPNTFPAVTYAAGAANLANATISWSGASGASGSPQYMVHLMLPDGTIHSRSSNTTSMTWAGLNGNQTYQYRVQTFCANGNASTFSAWQSFTVLNTYGSCGSSVTGINVSHVTSWGAKLDWTPAITDNAPETNGRTYWVQYWNTTNPNTIYTVVKDSSKIQLLVGVHQGLVAGQQYGCRVWYLCNGTLQSYFNSPSNFQLLTLMADKTPSSLARITTVSELGLTIYPNPAKQVAVISYQSAVSSKQLIDLVVVDALGREVYRETSQSPSLRTNLNVSKLAAGVYLVKVQDGEQTATKRLVLE